MESSAPKADLEGKEERLPNSQGLERPLEPAGPLAIQDKLPEEALPEIIKSEVNLLTLPFFALNNREVCERMETEFRAQVEREGKQVEIIWNVSANPKYGYPGPFDKRLHKAIEQIISEMSPPIQNPIPFSLYDLCRRVGTGVGGRQYQGMKEIMERIVATTIKSQGAFYHKGRKRWIDDTFHLYDRVIFKGEELPDGTVAETNYLYLSSWYLESINSFYLKPLDFDYYKSLNSTIAQRLYELLGVKFYRIIREGLECLRYRYSTLCQLLPIARQRYLSKAKGRLEPAHRELQKTGFLKDVLWEPTSEEEDWFIYYYPGPRAIAEAGHYQLPEDILTIEEQEIGPETQGRGQEQEKLPSSQSQDQEVYHEQLGLGLEEIEIKGLVQHMIEVLGDEHSRPFYAKVARACPSQVIYRILSEVKDEWLQGRVRRSKGALFTDKIKRYCRERGIDLGLRHAERSSGSNP
jgi:hypothetical protein